MPKHNKKNKFSSVTCMPYSSKGGSSANECMFYLHGAQNDCIINKGIIGDGMRTVDFKACLISYGLFLRVPLCVLSLGRKWVFQRKIWGWAFRTGFVCFHIGFPHLILK